MSRQPLHRQRGVAIVTALLLTTLAVTIVTSLFWQQNVQIRSIENQRLQLQKLWILRGAMDYAQLIIRNDDVSYDSLDDLWAVPLAETRLDQYLEKGENNTDASDAALWGSIVDAQSHFNLRNLLKPTTDDLQIDQVQVEIFERLLTSLKFDPTLAATTAQTMKASYAANSGSASTHELPISRMEDLLTIKGYTPAMVETLRKYVVMLDDRTPININTAPVEVIAAGIGTLSRATEWVTERKRGGYCRGKTDLDDRKARYNITGDDTVWFYKTNFFLVNGTVRMSHASLTVQALVQRSEQQQGKTNLLWIRQL